MLSTCREHEACCLGCRSRSTRKVDSARPCCTVKALVRCGEAHGDVADVVKGSLDPEGRGLGENHRNVALQGAEEGSAVESFIEKPEWGIYISAYIELF